MRKEQPLVSVLMTVYNREKYIAQAIESVMASTYQNWELIIVDDQSKDCSVEIARQFEARDKRIKVYINENNLGDYPNRNKAASYAKGKYLKYVDADDMLYPYGLEQLVFYMEKFPDAGYGLCSLEQDKNEIFPFQLSSQKTFERHYVINKSVFHKAPLSSIIKNEAFKSVDGFSNVRHYGDFDMWHKLSINFPVVLMPQGIVWYRQSDGQEAAVRKQNPINHLLTLECGMLHIENSLCPLSDNDKSVIIEKYKIQIARAVLSAAKHHSLKKALELKKASNMNLFNIIFKGIR